MLTNLRIACTSHILPLGFRLPSKVHSISLFCYFPPFVTLYVNLYEIYLPFIIGLINSMFIELNLSIIIILGKKKGTNNALHIYYVKLQEFFVIDV